MTSNQDNDTLRERSGTVVYDDALTSFLYELMRDHLPVGTVETLVRSVEHEDEKRVYTNGWLAKHAHDLANRLAE